MRLLTFLCAVFFAFSLHATEAPLKVVASFSILADIVKQVGGDKVCVETLVGPGVDAHLFQPAPSDARKLDGAAIFFINGLGFEGWTERLLETAGSRARLVTVSDNITTRTIESEEHDHGDGHGAHRHATGETDPHAWQSVTNIKTYVANIRDTLSEADALHTKIYDSNAVRYLKELDGLENDIKKTLAVIPVQKRVIITSHDALGYYGDAYGIKILAAQGMQMEGEPTAKKIAGLVEQIKKEGVRVLFVENVGNSRLLNQLREEAGAVLGGTLYSDALTTAPPADSYIGLMRSNTAQITRALQEAMK